MSETKFTQGPWLVAPEQVTGGYLVKPEGWSRGVCTVTQRDNHPLNGQGIDWDQAKANVNLIAAAPDLYDASVKAIKLLESLGMSGSDECQELFFALAKVEGG